MRIKLTTLMSGPAGCFQPGTEIDVDDAQGRELVVGNYAVELTGRRAETAMLKAPETAVTAEQEAAANLARIGKARGSADRKGRAAKPDVAPAAPTAE